MSIANTRSTVWLLQITFALLAVSLPCVAQPQPPDLDAVRVLSLNDAVGLALGRVSTFQASVIGQTAAAEDVRLARAAFLPRLSAPGVFTYNSPERGAMPTPGPGVAQSFIGLNAVREYQGYVSATGELDINGRLSATLRRNRLLLAAAQAGTEIARRDLIVATQEAYYGVALTDARLQIADGNLAAAEEFERITTLRAQGGEVPEIDASRARLQTATRLDEREQATASALIAVEGLRVFVGTPQELRLIVDRLDKLKPSTEEIESIPPLAAASRPEIRLFNSQRLAAEQDALIARAERRPSLLYTLNAGADSDSLQPTLLNRHLGTLTFVSLTIPIFDWGVSRSREKQARLRAETFGLQGQLFQRSLLQQYGSAKAQALAARERIAIISRVMADAERNVTTSIARYRAGEAPILEVTDAQNILAQQQQALTQAIYDYRTGIARLEWASGLTK